MNLQDVCAISVVGVDKHDLMWMKNAAKEACGNPFSRVHVSWQIPALLPCALLRHLYTKSLEDLRELIPSSYKFLTGTTISASSLKCDGKENATSRFSTGTKILS